MKQKLVFNEEIDLNGLWKEIDNGGRFIIFSYTISLFFAVSLKRFSPAFFIKKGECIAIQKRKYNWYNYLMGWWCIPSGPMLTLQSLKTNNKGGIDITGDIMLNITEESLTKKEVDIIFANTLFKHPDHSDLKEFYAVIKQADIQRLFIQQLVVGLYINTEEGESTFFVIGIKSKGSFDDHVHQLRKSLYKRFYKNVRFDFIDLLNNEDDISKKLLEQGHKLIS